MKYTKQCPKCKCRDIFMMDNDRMGEGMQQGSAGSMTYYAKVAVQQYICCRCGYSEQWVDRSSITGAPVYRNAYQLNR